MDSSPDEQDSDSADDPISPGEVLERLMAVIEHRRDHPPERSYTNALLNAGIEKIGAKILEEAGEVVEAAKEPAGDAQRAHVIYEAGDVIYHLFVLLGYEGISLSDVADEIARRFGTSGLDEKASRSTHKGS